MISDILNIILTVSISSYTSLIDDNIENNGNAYKSKQKGHNLAIR